MPTVEPIKDPVNASIDDVEKWAKLMAERGEYAPATARHYSTALRQLTSVLAMEEPRDPVSVLERLDDLGRRWGVKEGGKPETIATYVSRSRNILADFLKFQEDPAKFRGGSRRQPTPRPPPGDANSPRVLKTVTHSESASAAPQMNGDAPVRSIPLGGGREFRCQFDGELTKELALKVGVSLLMMCADFTTADVAKLARLAE